MRIVTGILLRLAAQPAGGASTLWRAEYREYAVVKKAVYLSEVTDEE